jgi:CrcB protein
VSGWAWLWFLVAAGVGAPARYVLDGVVQDRTSHAFPWGTLVVNVSGSFVLGMLTGWATYHHVDPGVRTAVGVGGIGAYTTFSTFSVDTVRLVEEGAPLRAVANLVLTAVMGVTAAAAGFGLTGLV